MEVPRNRRIWHVEAEPLCNALDDAGAWQTAVRIRVAHNDALRHRPEGTAFDVRPTPEDVAPLNLALGTLRAERARERRLLAYEDCSHSRHALRLRGGPQ
ncbi:MAG: hypothetical protein ACRDPC_15865 [Solirubrobacteraceae bacterium]